MPATPSDLNRDEQTFGDYVGETTRFLSWIRDHRPGTLPASILHERVARLRLAIAPLMFFDLAALKRAIIEVKKKKLANLDARSPTRAARSRRTRTATSRSRRRTRTRSSRRTSS